MADAHNDFVPSGPVDPVAAQIGAFFTADATWSGKANRPAAETRAAIKAMTPVLGTPAMEHVEDFRVPVAGGDIGLRFYRPTPKPMAIIIWAHGGGFTLGSLDETDNFARALAKESNCAVASVDYRLAPEHKFPTAVNDLLAATQWVAARRNELAGGIVPVLLGGDSAGGNLATVVTRKLHETNAGSIAGNVLAYPCTESDDTPSIRRFVPPFLTLDDIQWCFDQYVPDRAARTNPDFAPMRAPNLGKLPPTLIITAEHDLITEQSETYGHKLADAGVDVEIIRHPGMIHGFLTLDAFFAGAAGKAMREISDFAARITK